jgi:hypothetical protein
MKRILWLVFTVVVAMNLGGPALTLAGPPSPLPTPGPLPDEACDQVPGLCLHQ